MFFGRKIPHCRCVLTRINGQTWSYPEGITVRSGLTRGLSVRVGHTQKVSPGQIRPYPVKVFSLLSLCLTITFLSNSYPLITTNMSSTITPAIRVNKKSKKRTTPAMRVINKSKKRVIRRALLQRGVFQVCPRGNRDRLELESAIWKWK